MLGPKKRVESRRMQVISCPLVSESLHGHTDWNAARSHGGLLAGDLMTTAKAHHATEAKTHHASHHAAHHAAEDDTPSANGSGSVAGPRRLLIVEDDETARRPLQKLLQAD